MIEEKIVIGKDTKYPLDGILTLPKDMSELLPAVVLVQGSGPSNMDEQIGENRPFKDIAETLSEMGIAVIRHDKRTFKYARELCNETVITVKEESIDDAIMAVNLLKEDERIDKNRIFIAGHSLGAVLAPRIDEEGADVRGLILMAGSPRKLEEILIEQNDEIYKSFNKFLKFIAKKQIQKLKNNLQGLYSMSDEEAKKKSVMGKHIKAYYFKELGEKDTVKYLQDTHKPIFIIQGSKDAQVSVERDFNKYKELLQNKPNVEFKLYENLNHLFMPAIYGEIAKINEEYKVAQNVEKVVIEDIAKFIHSVV